MIRASPQLEVEDISVRFGGVSAVSHVSFSIQRGELLALIGPNGAGKTTLLNAIAGALAPTSGHIRFNGVPIENWPAHRVNAIGIGRTFQAAEPLRAMSVRDNVMAGGVAASKVGLMASLIGLGRARKVMGELRRRADDLLAQVGLAARADEPASVLTAGQRRLLAIARALATGAELLLLDEPGAGLSEAEKQALVAVIRAFAAAGKTVMFVEHDMAFVGQLSQRIIVLDHSVLIGDGRPEVIRSDPKVIEAYLGRSKAVAAVPAPPSPGSATPRPTLLHVRNMSVEYGGLRALDNASLDVGDGEIVALIGANGAGKSTLLKALARIERSNVDEMSFLGTNIGDIGPDQVVMRGLTLVPEGRALFASLSVLDNLLAGRYAARRVAGIGSLLRPRSEEVLATEQRLRAVYDLFPVLQERRDQLAGALSGGQGQMLAIARALMGAPRLLMLDEPSLGLAPQVVEEIMRCLDRLRAQGLTILLVEQNAAAALDIADRAYVLANGRIVNSGLAGELRNDPAITSAYLGVGNDIGGAAKGVAAAATGAWLAAGSGGPTSILTPSLASAAGAGSQAASPIAAQDTGRGDFRSRPDRALSLRRT
jgi:branched-chain amino acid transport system ATP-binding protein